MMKLEHAVLVLSVTLGLLVGLADALLDYWFFYEGTLWNLIIADVPAHEIYVRSVILAAFTAFGLVVSRVLAKQKLAEKAMRESEEQFRLLAEASLMGVFIIREMKFTYVNPTAARIFGYPLEAMTGELGPLDLTHPEDHSASKAQIGRCSDLIDCEVTATGITLNGEPAVIGTLVDVTEHKRSAEAIRRSEARLRSIFRAAPIGIGVVSNRILKEANEQLCEMVGYDREELVGRSARLLYPTEEDYAYVGREKYGQIRTEGTGTVETRWRRRDGAVIDVLLSSTPIDPADHSVGVTFTALDITERKRAEAEREALIADLEAKNAELEQFTYTVSHDLKSPLITIKGYLGLLREDLSDGNLETVDDDLQRMSGAADKMEQLLNELLELSRIGRLVNPSENVALGDLVEEALEMVGGQIAEKNVDAEVEPDLPVVYGDRPRLVEVLQNLIDNAVKYMGDQPEPRVEIGARVDDEEVVCHVRDNGLGIKPVYHEKIFGLFEKLDARTEGSGVGLALVKRIVEVHGGRIWVESGGAGRGSTFFFALPRSSDSAEPGSGKK
ncbi:MAG: sensor histidine kinase [Planctomycetota bacterium]|jgi:PAS domain S-box-containing protein